MFIFAVFIFVLVCSCPTALLKK
uniref:Uncharacterized protein n=1 Tax=Anguilla anguilla TaxID=7936 RepID=A0A0E9P7Y7_ANGAN